MNSHGYNATLKLARELGYTIQDGTGRLYPSWHDTAATLAESPPSGILAASTLATAHIKAVQDLADTYNDGDRVRSLLAYNGEAAFTGVCTGFNRVINLEAHPVVIRDDTGDQVPCCVDLLEDYDPEEKAFEALIAAAARGVDPEALIAAISEAAE